MPREKDEITVDFIDFANLSVYQRKKGYRFSLDSVLLANFAFEEGIRGDVLEVGAGVGVVSMLIARSERAVGRIVAVEIQESLAEMARINMATNHLAASIEVVNADVREYVKGCGKMFDAVVSNPPFGRVDAGRVNPDREKRIARHEYTLDAANLGTVISSSLSAKGKFFLIYPARRLLDVGCKMNRRGLKLEKIRLVHSFRDKEAEFVLMKGGVGKQSETTVMPPLYIYKRADTYSAEVVKIYRGMIRK